MLPSLTENLINPIPGLVVAGDLIRRQHGFKAAHQIRRAHDGLAHFAQHFHRSRIQHGDVHDRVARRILHRDSFVGGEHRVQPDLQLLPGRINALRAGQRVETCGFEPVNQLARLA